MKNNGFFIAVIFASGMMVARGLTLDTTIPEEKAYEGVKRTFKGSIEPLQFDSITYDQHPQKKCWHLNYENR